MHRRCADRAVEVRLSALLGRRMDRTAERPDQGRALVFDCFRIVALQRDVSFLGDVEAQKVTRHGLGRMFRRSQADVKFVAHDDGRADKIIVDTSRTHFPGRRHAIAFPDELACLWPETVEDAIAAGEDDLRDIVDAGKGGAGPLPVDDVGAGRLDCQTSLPVFLCSATKLGALGDLSSSQTRPLPVMANTHIADDERRTQWRRDGRTPASPRDDLEFFRHVVTPSDVARLAVGTKDLRLRGRCNRAWPHPRRASMVLRWLQFPPRSLWDGGAYSAKEVCRRFPGMQTLFPRLGFFAVG